MGKGVCGPLPYPPRPEIVELREFPDFFVELSAGVFFSISDLRMSWKRHFWSISGLKKQIFRLRRAYYSSINSDWLQFLQSTRPWFLNSTIQLLLIQQQCNEAERNLSETFKNWKNFRDKQISHSFVQLDSSSLPKGGEALHEIGTIMYCGEGTFPQIIFYKIASLASKSNIREELKPWLLH